jgi:hypothetical protein
MSNDITYDVDVNVGSEPKLPHTAALQDIFHCARDHCKSDEVFSYLDRPRFHFSGIFKSDTLTINNYFDNFDVDHYEEINEMLARDENTGFNPTGTGDFFFESCTVTMVCPEDGSCTTDNPLVGQPLESFTGENAGKMVDLDVEVEEHAGVIYGLSIGIDLGGNKPFVGRLYPSQVTDTWRSVWDVGNATDEGQFGQASIQSVLADVKWNENSPLFVDSSVGDNVLQQMYKKVHDGYLLSVKFNMDHYEELNASDPFFLFGRLSGTVGLTRKSEPLHFVRGRHLHSYKVPNDPEGRSYANVAPFVINSHELLLTIDLGNALSRSTFDGSWNNQYLGNKIAIVTQQSQQLIGSVDLSSDKWYLQQAGVFEFHMTSIVLQAVQLEPLEVITDTGLPILSETEYFIRPINQPFAKLNPGDQWSIDFFVTQLGKSLCNYPILAQLSLISQHTESVKARKALDALKITNGEALDDLQTHQFISDCTGQFRIEIEASNPGNARGYVDGEIYQLDVTSNSISHTHLLVRVYDQFNVPDEPTWHGQNGVERIIKLYEMLYPFTTPSLFQSNYEDLISPVKRESLIKFLSLDESLPQSLPVARDLSMGKRETLIRWLQNPVKGRKENN